MSSTPAPQLSALADPLALARLQVLLVPVHNAASSSKGNAELTDAVFDHWSGLFRSHQTLRGDEILHGALSPRSPSARPGKDGQGPRGRFLPNASAASISRGGSSNHVHLAFPAQPPAKHLYPLSLLRMTSFPLVVVGIAVEDGDDEVEGYSVDGKLEPAKDKKGRPRPTLQTQGWDSAFRNTLASILPETSAFPLVKRLVLVPSQTPSPSSRQGTPARKGSLQRKDLSTGGQTIVRAPLDGGDNWVARLLGELVGEVFGELGELVSRMHWA